MKLRVRLIQPNSFMHTLGVWRWRRSMREAPLALTTLASLAPPELDIRWQLFDGTVQRIRRDARCDLVCISIITGTAAEGYRLARHFRGLGLPVVLGGVHVKLCPDEAAAHADTIVVGMAERTWPQLLRDFAAGRMQPRYEETQPEECIGRIPTPRYDLVKRTRYNAPSTVMAGRGCPHRCRFCISTPLWGGYLHRPLGDVVRDVDAAPGKVVVFNDVNLLADRPFAMELLGEMRKRRRIWGCLATLATADDAEMLEALRAAGCRYVLVGMESLSPGSLCDIDKGFNRVEDYRRQISAFHAMGISIQACLMFGLDHDGPEVFDQTVERMCELKIDIPRYSLLTPFPGTAIFEQMSRDGRIISRNWDDYDTMHVVFQPARMSPWELFDGFRRAYRQTFTLKHIRARMAGASWRGLINGVGNLTYRRFTWRLYHQERFAAPNSVLRGRAGHA